MISVIIPCYNAEKTILRCLESLLAGSFRDFEVIIADDGSSDGTPEICRGIQDARLRFLPSEKNRGVSHARNRGLDAARGEYVAFVDADDSVKADYLHLLSQAAYAENADWVSCAFSFVDEFNPAREVHSLPPAFPEDTVLRPPALGEYLPGMILYNQEKSTLASVCGCLYRRSILEAHHIRFREGLRYGEDTLFNLCFAARCESFSYLSRKLYRYHQHEGESTDIMFRRYHIRDLAALLKEIEGLRAKNKEPLSQAESQYVLSQTFAYINHNALLKTADKGQAFYEEMDQTYWSEPSIVRLWNSMRSKDICGNLNRMRFLLIKGRQWKKLAALQRAVRKGKKILKN